MNLKQLWHLLAAHDFYLHDPDSPGHPAHRFACKHLPRKVWNPVGLRCLCQDDTLDFRFHGEPGLLFAGLDEENAHFPSDEITVGVQE